MCGGEGEGRIGAGASQAVAQPALAALGAVEPGSAGPSPPGPEPDRSPAGLCRPQSAGRCSGLPAVPKARVTHLCIYHPLWKPISVLFFLFFVNIKTAKRIKTFLLQFSHLGSMKLNGPQA